MAKITCCEDLVFERLQTLMQDEQFSIGLLIGQISGEDNYIVHFAPVPKVEPDEGSGKQHENLKPTCLASVSETVLTSHARQVSRMLPGGLDVIGIYSILDSTEVNKSTNQEKIKKLLHALNITVSKHFLGLAEPSSETLFLFGCNKSAKTGIKCLNMMDSNASLASGELKSYSTSWIEVDYTYSLSQNLSLSKESASQALSKNVTALLQPWTTRVAESLILIDGKLRNEGELLHPSLEEKPTKKRLGGAAKSLLNFAPPKVMRAEFLEKTPKPTCGASLQEVSSSLVFSGTIVGRAFLSQKSTVQDAMFALRKDLVRSLVSRWEMHCDSLIDEPPGSSTGPVFHEPPRRVFLEGGGLPVSLCDYLFPGDTPSDACLSAKELLDIVVSEENVDVTLETCADPSELLVESSLNSPSTSPMAFAGTMNTSTHNIYIYTLSIAVAIFSLCAFYLLFAGHKDM